MKFVLHLIFLHKRYENIFGWLKALSYESYEPKFARSFLLRMLPKTAILVSALCFTFRMTRTPATGTDLWVQFDTEKLS